MRRVPDGEGAVKRPVGRRLGPYTLGEFLGGGAWGEVYRAEHRLLGRARAVKVLRPELAADADLVRRFEREANLAAGLRHPNIVVIHDIGVARRARYIAMELVEGRSLARLLREEGPPTAERALGLLGQLAGALDYAHGAEVLHRDLKPSNVMVGPDDRVTLVDFGIARALDRAAGPRLTQSGTYLGTPEYIAPEVIAGGEGGAGDDLYALGVIAYELLVGRLPFAGAQAVQVLYAQVYEPPPNPRSLRAELPEGVEAALLRQLAKDPAERFDSAEEFVAALGGPLAPGAAHTPRAVASARPLRRRAGNLPIPPTPLLGREREIAALEDLLLREEVRLLTLTGPAGVGKTRLALEVAARLAGAFAAGACLSELAPVRDPDLVPSSIAQALGVRETQGRPLRESLIDYLREKRLLLLLDNFERVVAAAPFLAELLAQCPRLRVLVTSREVLRLRGEHEYAPAPLAVPDLEHLPNPEALIGYAAVSLFCQRAEAAKPDFRLTGETARSVAEICVRLDGLPLAIELAAARVKLLPLPALLARLENQLEVLTGGARDLPERQRTLRGAITWSYDLLPERERALFQRLSVFQGGCSLEAAEAVCAGEGLGDYAILDLLSQLVDKSLVTARSSGECARYRLLESVRQFGIDRLKAAGEWDAARSAHLRYFLAQAERAERALDGPGEQAWLDWLELEHDNLRAALSWSLSGGQEALGLRLAGTLRGFWQVRGYWGEGRAWLERALAKGGNVAAADRDLDAARAKALAASGTLATLQGAYAEAGPPLEEGLRLFRGLEDRAGVAGVLNDLGNWAIYKGDLKAAEAYVSESLALSRASGDTKGIAQTLESRARIATFQGDPASLQLFARESLAAWREIQGKRGIAGALMSLGIGSLYASDFGAARRALEEALSIQRELQDRLGMAQTLSSLGYLVLGLGDAAAAQLLAEEAVALSRQLGNRWQLASQLGILGFIAQRRGDPALARRSVCRSLELFSEIQDKSGMALQLYHLGYLWQDEGRTRGAVRLYSATNAQRLANKMYLPPSERELWDSYLTAARAALGEEDFAAAWAEGEATTLDEAVAYALEDAPTD
jgi:non-specific serine/threonine protein kinase